MRLKTVTSSTELLCWYEGAADPDSNTKDSDLLPMPVLEKMDVGEDLPFRAFQKIPSPLQVLPENSADALEPPLISPMFPVPAQGIPPPESHDMDKISSAVEPGVIADGPQIQVVAPAIQAPDVTSTGEEDGDLKQILPLSMGGKDDSDIVTSSQLNTADRLMKDKLQKKTTARKLMTSKGRKKLVSKYRKDLLKESGQGKGSWKVRKDKEFHEMIMEPYIIGPDSVVVDSEGSERYICQKCGKLCKYPVGLKIHLRTNHHFCNVFIKGIAKKPWARGITKERERNPHTKEPPDKLENVTWKSVDCSLVASALEKLKESGEEKELGDTHIKSEFNSAGEEVIDSKVVECLPNVSDEHVLPDSLATNNVICQDTSERVPGVTGSESDVALPQVQPKVESEQEIPLSSSDKGIEGKGEEVSGDTTQAASSAAHLKGKSAHIFPKKYSCHICHQAFAYKFWRDRHLQKHLKGDSGHICQVCNLRFFSKKNLISHQKTHKEEEEGIIENERESENAKSFKNPAIMHSETVAVERTGVAKYDRLSWSQDEHSRTTDHRGKGNRNLEYLVNSLQKKKSKLKSSSEGTTKGNQTVKSNQLKRGGGDRKYLCRLCGSAFSNPSNRSRHMRAQHGVAARKKVVESRLKEKNMDFVVVEETVSNMFEVPSASCVTQKPSLHPAIQEGKRKSENLIGRKHPRAKVKVNKIVAHQRCRSKRKSTFMIEFLDYEEFPRSPEITCPWDRVNLPGPYIPQKKSDAVDMTMMKSESLSCSEKGSFHRTEQGFSDSLLGWAGSLPDNDDHLMEKYDMFAKKSKIFYPGEQPLDLSCKSRCQTVGKNLLGSLDAFNEFKPAYRQDKHTLQTKGRGQYTVLKQERRRGFKGKKISSKISQKQNAASLNPVKWHFVCNICDGSFMSIRELSHHVIAHAEDYPYKCEFCMNVFISCDALKEHKQTKHSVKKMYTCSVCKQEFAYLSNLKKHQNVEHSGVECTHDENFSNDVRPQNFTDPTKAFNLRVCPSFTSERVSFLKEEMDKLTPLKNRVVSPTKKTITPLSSSPKKQAQEKGMLFNPQRNHPFEKRRKIGFLSMLSDPRNQKQLGSKVNNVCTKCLQEFKDTSEFHVHIMECANIKDEASTELKEEWSENSRSSNKNNHQEGSQVVAQTKQGRKGTKSPRKQMPGAGRSPVERAKPGSIMYDPQKYIRIKSSSSLEDIHACAGCGKKFYFINKLERHMKLCPNRDKIVSANKSNVALALRKRPRLNTVQHKCTNCEKHFTYLGSLEKHLLLCTSRDLISSHPGESQPNGGPSLTGSGDGNKSLQPSLPTQEQESPTEKTESHEENPTIGTGKRKRRRKSFESYWQLGKS
ncbi:PR domain zinc finger protein 2 [Holothuria leucospilota]|uniref:PR domain zinc finger protein 2 n=1 Tax=Holothuria leucospilota TaxID=206669 RepID=A0A9Q1C9F6_HOLLE|nr:PR domain zinc finger protein 2 [Holothuria leucospilota]